MSDNDWSSNKALSIFFSSVWIGSGIAAFGSGEAGVMFVPFILMLWVGLAANEADKCSHKN